MDNHIFGYIFNNSSDAKVDIRVIKLKLIGKKHLICTNINRKNVNSVNEGLRSN